MIAGIYMQHRSSGRWGDGWLLIYGVIFYFSQWLVAVSGLLWLIKMGAVGVKFTLMTGSCLGLIIGVIDFFYCLLSEAKTPEEQIGGVGLSIVCFFFSLFFGSIIGALLTIF